MKSARAVHLHQGEAHPGQPGQWPADFAEAVLSLKLAREELQAGRLTLHELYARAEHHLEVAADYLAEFEGLQHAPVLLRRSAAGRRHMFSTAGVVKLYFTSGVGRRLAKVFNTASNRIYSHPGRRVTESSMMVWLPVKDFCRAVRLYHKTCRRIRIQAEPPRSAWWT
ncbi:hypothetical protein WJ96_05260 [Burkholderia ubonensis]|uniref:Uncharacterized protein n=1 Tax=Burkholderia ubonensis TaxID=101571 RepID=A0AAW3MYA8_9BURK|nr:hypothetical protein [Burkholderia ubonensis]KVP97980.1 hypothetical protein WJ96_05260 [Burkholderia ubonensis]KVZ92677.1 hypothetical protein WL25_16915 [Burkholderia ubonensis]